MAELRPRIARDNAGRIALRLSTQERAILGAYVQELRDVVATDGPATAAKAEPTAASDPDPAIARLYPDAIPGDSEAEAAFRDLTRAGLENTRRSRLATVDATLDARSLDDGEASAWLGALNDLRLVLGTRLEVTGDGEAEPIDTTSPDAIGARCWTVARPPSTASTL